MIAFVGGPADGVRLCLRRAPVVLRVTRSAAGHWDALDMPDDEATSDEEVHPYVLDGEVAFILVRWCQPGGNSLVTSATYRHLVSPSPPEAAMRSTESWRHWCRANESGIRRTAGIA